MIVYMVDNTHTDCILFLQKQQKGYLQKDVLIAIRQYNVNTIKDRL